MLKTIINTGVTSKLNFFEKRALRLLNGIAIACIAVCIMSQVITIPIVGYLPEGMMSSVFGTISYGLILFFNKRKNYYISKALFISYSNLSMLLVYFTMPGNVGADLLFLAVFALYPSFFKKTKTIIILSVISFAIMCFGKYIYLFDVVEQPVQFDEKRMIMVNYVFLTISVSIITLVTFFYKKSVDDTGAELEEKNSELENALMLIQNQKAALEENLEEKTILLKEIHHRVKNNLQIITSLLDLQLGDINDEQAQEKFTETKKRVTTIALVHEKLYQSSNLSALNLKTYVQNLIKDISSAYETGEIKATKNINIQDLEVDIDKIVPIGIVINELITNAYKHSFIPNETGILDVKILKEHDNKMSLEVKSSGDNIELEKLNNSKSLGMTLVKILTKQLNGELHITKNKGLIVTIKFPYE